MARRITCDCCRRQVSPGRWDDDAGVCHYCLRAQCVVGRCRRATPAQAASAPAAGRLDPGTLYLGDNGRAFCGADRCAGATAFYSGHDLSGQPVLALTPAQAQAHGVRCEGCGMQPSAPAPGPRPHQPRPAHVTTDRCRSNGCRACIERDEEARA